MTAHELLAEGPMADLSAPYYAGLVEGRLLIQQCHGCQAKIMYPKYRCPRCLSADLDWVESPGEGLLHSFTVLRLGSPSGYEADLPYAVCVVKLDEGVQLLGRLRPGADGTWDQYRCDQRVSFQPAEPGQAQLRPAPWFGAA